MHIIATKPSPLSFAEWNEGITEKAAWAPAGFRGSARDVMRGQHPCGYSQLIRERLRIATPFDSMGVLLPGLFGVLGVHSGQKRIHGFGNENLHGLVRGIHRRIEMPPEVSAEIAGDTFHLVLA